MTINIVPREVSIRGLTTRFYRMLCHGRVSLVIAVLMLIAFQTACQAQGKASKVNLTGSNKMETKEPVEMPKLVVDYQISGDTLEVEYGVKNESSRAIYIFNVLLAPGSMSDVADKPFYACLRNDGTLLLAKMIAPVPRIRSVEFRQIPFATKVEPGASFSAKERVKLPIEEFNPYFPQGPTSKVEPAESERVQFVLQFVRETEGLEAKETDVPNAYKLHHKALLSLVETLNSAERPLQLKVERRTDSFERF